MKRNMKFFTIVISLLLLSSIILTGCMYVIATDNGEMKPYDLNRQKENSDSSGGNIVEDAPLAQESLQGKFKDYLHQEGKAITVFSEEQYTELKAVRESGKRTPLTYDEILFLVNDSINMYLTYDEIRLYNACVDSVLPLTSGFASVQSSNACIIYPYHGDYSEFESYSEAEQAYNRMIQEIYAIIYYRIYMHDAGFARIFHCANDLIVGQSSYKDYSYLSSAVPSVMYQMLAIDGDTVGGLENEEKLVNEYKKIVEWEREQSTNYIDPDKKFSKLNSKVLSTKVLNDKRQPMEYTFCIYESAEAFQIIYPTKELTSMKPQQEVMYQATKEDHALQPVFSLNYETGRAAMSAGVEFSFAMFGKFQEHDGVLKIYFEDNGNETTYSYVFYKYEQGYVYSAENSKPAKRAGFDFADGRVFEK